MTTASPGMAPTRSRSDRGWRLAGLLGLMLITFVWMPLGARDAAGVSSVLPALRPVSLAQPAGTTVGRAATAAAHAQPHAPRPAPLAAEVAALIVLLAVVTLELCRGPEAADRRRNPTLSGLGSRGPPAVH